MKNKKKYAGTKKIFELKNGKNKTSEHLFSENDCLTKNEVSICDDNTSCSSSSHNQPPEFMQNAQGWCDFVNDVGHKTFEIQKQHTSTYVQTESFEIDENTRLNNLMFCKFISHELDNCIGNDRYEKMQKFLEVFKK